ncbi:ABC transporter ATP-binding protein [Yinghuangia seranimata]|uniref:ABC transporter ATP-binding protein n=1 Tax=Yinghuangia seranimata TaxID=408067 RepID=UPI00248B7B4A|nr:ABC transporter ATP-binding protein [Yinghuangia seranimata]MDI2124743.1 ABC transporter ATP-binding protein [Yinghuangia seranimata]
MTQDEAVTATPASDGPESGGDNAGTRWRLPRQRRRVPRVPGRSARALFGGWLEYEGGYGRHVKAWQALTLRQMARTLPQSLRKAVALAWSADPRAALTVLAAEIAQGVMGAVGLLATNSALVQLFAAGPTPDRVRASFPALLSIVAAAALGQVCAGVSTVATGRLEPKVERAADEELLTCASRVELATLEDPEFVGLLEAARAGCDSARQMLGSAVGIIGAVISLIAAGSVLAVLHPVLLPMLGLIVVPHAYGTLATSRRTYASRRTWLDHERMLDQLSYLLTSQSTGHELRVHGGADHLLDHFRGLSMDAEAEQVRLARATAATNIVAAAASGIATGLTYVVLGWLLLSSRVPLSTAGTAVLAIRSGSSGLRTVVQQASRLFADVLYFDDFRTACATAREHAVPDTGLPVPEPPALIELSDVSFTYPDKDAPALDGVSLAIPQGSVVALVGENGSGKSTLAKIIAACYAPSAGTVMWDGVDVAALNRAELQGHVALVSQEFVHWPFTAGYNIRMGRAPAGGADGAGAPIEAMPDYDADPAFSAAVAFAGAEALLPNLPRGWDTLVSRSFAGGAQLSGGEWQRTAIGRAAFRDAELMIFDEPTAALDPAAEIAAYDNVRRLADSGHTVVLVSHRMASTRRADRIVVLDHGRVVENGTWDELMALPNGRYRTMFGLQAAEFATKKAGNGHAPDAERGGA